MDTIFDWINSSPVNGTFMFVVMITLYAVGGVMIIRKHSFTGYSMFVLGMLLLDTILYCTLRVDDPGVIAQLLLLGFLPPTVTAVLAVILRLEVSSEGKEKT